MRVLLVAHVLLGPLALGGREPWYQAAAASMLAVAWGLWLGAAACRGEMRLRSHWLFVLPLLLLAMAAIQRVPWTAWVRIAPASAARWQELAAALGAAVPLRACLAPSEALDATIVVFLVLAFSFLAYQVFGNRRDLCLLAAAIAAAAFLEALLGYAALLELTDPPYEALRGPTHAMSGTFWNRNHFGQFMVFGALQTMGLALAAWFSHIYPSRRARGTSLYVQLHWRGITVSCVVAALALGGAALLSTSRGAFLAGGTALLLLLGQALRHRRARPRLAVASAIFLLLALAGGHAALGRLAARFDALLSTHSLGLDVRARIWRESLVVLRNHWTVGIGPEGFRTVSPRYEGAWKGGLISLHAHNDWLELLIEYGLPLGLPVLLAGLAWLCLALRKCSRQRDPLLCWTGLGAGCALIAAALHSLVDWPLRSPGMLTAAGAAAVVLSLSGRARNGRVRCWHWHSPRLLRTVVPPLSLALLALVAWQTPSTIAAGRARSRLRDLTEPRRGALSPASLLPTSLAAIDLSERVLSHSPHHVLSRKTRGAARHAICVLNWRKLAAGTADADVTPECIAEELEQSVTDLQAACRLGPCDSRSLVLLAHASECLRLLTDSPDEAQLQRLYELAEASGPAIPDTAFASAEGLWRLCLRTGQTDGAARARAIASYTAAVRLVPRQADKLIRCLRDTGSTPAEIRAAIPRRIPAHEALYHDFSRRALYEECLRELDTIQDLNRQRTETTETVYYTPEDAGQAPPPIDKVADSIASRRIRLLGMLGQWGKRDAQIRKRQLLGGDACRKRLDKALAWLAAGSPESALPLLLEVCRTAPDLGEAHVDACQAFRAADLGDEALGALLPLIYRTGTDFPPAVYRAAITEVDDELSRRRTSAPPVPYAELLRLALEVRDANQSGRGVTEATLQRLAAASSRLRNQDAPSWSQAHLAPYYLALAYEGRGNPAAAGKAFADVLGRCPLHLEAARRLEHLTKSSQTDSPLPSRAEELLATTSGLVPLTGDLSPWLGLLGFRLTPLTQQPLGPVRLTMVVLCTGQPVGGGKLSLRIFQNEADGFPLDLPLTAPEGDPPTWRVGQAVVLTTDLSPTLLAARAGHPFVPGSCFLSVRLAPLAGTPSGSSSPPLAGLAFRIDPKSGTPVYTHD